MREGLVLISSMDSLLVADSMKSQPSRSKYPCFFSKIGFEACKCNLKKYAVTFANVRKYCSINMNKMNGMSIKKMCHIKALSDADIHTIFQIVQHTQ